MKNRLLQLAAGLALMAVLGKFYAVPLIAQVRAAVVKNIDERGRAPYIVSATCFSRPFSGVCMASFPAVPANRRLVVEYVNGQLDADHGLFSSAYLSVPSASSFPIRLASHVESFDDFRDLYSISMPVVFYYEAGQMPVVSVQATVLAENPLRGGSFTLSGYLVDLTQ
jgi:hypothetical protein